MKNQESGREDRRMTAGELQAMGFEQVEENLILAIRILRNIDPVVVQKIEQQLQDVRVKKNTLNYLANIADPEEQLHELNRIAREGAPAAVYHTDENFIIEGPSTLQ